MLLNRSLTVCIVFWTSKCTEWQITFCHCRYFRSILISTLFLNNLNLLGDHESWTSPQIIKKYQDKIPQHRQSLNSFIIHDSSRFWPLTWMVGHIGFSLVHNANIALWYWSHWRINPESKMQNNPNNNKSKFAQTVNMPKSFPPSQSYAHLHYQSMLYF